MIKIKTQYARMIRALALCLLLLAPSLAIAQDAPESAGYTVRAILPENQLEAQSYFSLLTQPGQTQTIEVEVENHQADPLTLKIEVTDAYTSRHGVIAYGASTDEPRGQTLPDMLQLALNPLAVGTDPGLLFLQDDQLTIAPNAVVRIPFQLTMLDTPLEGQVLGGIVLTQADATSETEASSFAIRNVFSHAIAVQLQQQETQDMQPDFALDAAAMEQTAGYPALSLSLRNNMPLVISGATLNVRVFARDEQQALLEKSGLRISMAPDSAMDYIVPLGDDEALSPGTYNMQVEVTFAGWTQGLLIPLVVEDQDAR